MDNEYGPKAEKLPEVAYYYPNPYIGNVDWVKNLLLFFEGIAVLIPDYMDDHLGLDDEAVIAGLKEHGLFRVFRPETLVDAAVTEELASCLVDVIASGALDGLTRDASDFGSISMSRMGYYGQEELAHLVFEGLQAKGLAHRSADGKSIPIHREVRALILVLLAQILKNKGPEHGCDLSPVTDNPRYVGALAELFSHPALPTAGHVVAFDLKEIGVDLGAVPIDEVLSFRKENLKDYRKYLLNVRKFVRELSEMPEGERTLAFEDRKATLDEMAEALGKVAQKAWKKPVAFALGLTGTGIGVAVAAPAAAVGGVARMVGTVFGGLGQEKQPDLVAFSYLFKAQRQFPQGT